MSYGRCACDKERVGTRPRFDVDSYQVQFVPSLPDKARIWPGTYHIQIDSDRWRSWDALQRMAVLAHEIAHDEEPLGCEACIDARAGARLRWQGVSFSAAVDAMARTVERRQTREAVAFGWKAADEIINRGLSTRDLGTLVNKREDLFGNPEDARQAQLGQAKFKSADDEITPVSVSLTEDEITLEDPAKLPGAKPAPKPKSPAAPSAAIAIPLVIGSVFLLAYLLKGK